MKNIVLIGMMGCGKTTISQLLSKELSRPCIDIDEYIEEKNHMSIPEMFAISEDYFRDKETICCQEVGQWDGYIISTGGGVIKRHENIEALKQNGCIVYLDRPVENICQDVDMSSRPLLKDGMEALYQIHHERHQIYLDACDIHIMNDSTIDDVIQRIKEGIQ